MKNIGQRIFVTHNNGHVCFIIWNRISNVIVGFAAALIFIFGVYIPIIAILLSVYSIIEFFMYKRIFFDKQHDIVYKDNMFFGLRIKRAFEIKGINDCFFQTSLTYQLVGDFLDYSLIKIEIINKKDNRFFFGVSNTQKTINKLKEIVDMKLNIAFVENHITPKDTLNRGNL